VLRKESEGEVTQGETESLDRSDRLPGLTEQGLQESAQVYKES
jgi:hypothetical protein